MQQNDKMHPDDKRNLIIFGLCSLMLWFSYDHFVLKPKAEAIRAAQEVSQQVARETQSENGMLEDVERPRGEIIAEGQRVPIETKLVKGSVNLTGARLDDVALTQHYKTSEKLENSVVLSPAGSPHPKYVEQGWVAKTKNVNLPDSKSQWRLSAGSVLTSQTPITLGWSNGQGLTFEKVISINEDYGFELVERVINNTGKEISLYPYSLIAQRGVPEEFQGRWVVHEGPMVYFGDELIEKTYGKMGKEPVIKAASDKGWIALTSKSWLTALVPDQKSEMKYRITYTKAAHEEAKDRYQTDMMGQEKIVPAGGMAEFKTNVFAGAKKLSLLEKYEKAWNMPHFDLAVDFGWFYFLTKPFFFVINFFYGLVGNFGVAIIMFTVLLRICVFPLANTSFKSFAKMRQIGPEMSELREKYKDDKSKLQQELVKLYQKEKVNPMAGCLPIVVQIPIFFSLFKVLSNTIEMRHAPFFGWIQDLSAPDPTSVFNLFGLLPFTPPQMMMIGVWPCLMLITMIIQRKLSPPPTDKFQAQLIAAMPWLMTLILAQFAAGLVIYWTFNNLFATIQQYIIMRRMGVDVDLLGNILGKKKETEPTEDVKAEAVKTKTDVEDAPKNAAKKKVSKPKPKKSKKKK